MALWQGVLTVREQDSMAGTRPREAYFMPHPTVAGRYVLGVGAKGGEAVAFLKFSPIASAPGRYVLDDDGAEEDRRMFLIGQTRVMV